MTSINNNSDTLSDTKRLNAHLGRLYTDIVPCVEWYLRRIRAVILHMGLIQNVLCMFTTVYRLSVSDVPSILCTVLL